MKTSKELTQEQENFRKEVENTFIQLREKVKELYIKETDSDVCPEGSIQLPTGYIHQYIDDQTNEVINGIDTERDCFVLDSGYNVSEIDIEDVSTPTLIRIIEDLENMIENPSDIEII